MSPITEPLPKHNFTTLKLISISVLKEEKPLIKEMDYTKMGSILIIPLEKVRNWISPPMV